MGRACVDAFVAADWNCISADLVENANASQNVVLSGKRWHEQVSELVASSAPGTLDAVVCAAGGWSGGALGDHEAAISGAEAMIEACYKPALSASTIAYSHLKPDGLLVLTGAAAALGPTPSMIGYGMAKAATGFVAQSAAAPHADGGLPEQAHVTVVAPGVIDSPANRSGMPDADFGAWTPPEVIADFILMRANGGMGREGAKRGEVVEPVTKKGVTTWVHRA